MRLSGPSAARSEAAAHCPLYAHLELPASNASGPPYTYRYSSPRLIRVPDAQRLCDADTEVFAGINSAVFNFERRKAVGH